MNSLGWKGSTALHSAAEGAATEVNYICVHIVKLYSWRWFWKGMADTYFP